MKNRYKKQLNAGTSTTISRSIDELLFDRGRSVQGSLFVELVRLRFKYLAMVRISFVYSNNVFF